MAPSSFQEDLFPPAGLLNGIYFKLCECTHDLLESEGSKISTNIADDFQDLRSDLSIFLRHFILFYFSELMS